MSKQKAPEEKPKWTLKKVKVSDLKDYYKNPRFISDEQAEHLKTSLNKFGLIDKPIVNQDLMIIGGHQRKKVYEGEEIEVWYPDRELDKKEVEELNIRLNANQGEWDKDVLASQWNLSDLNEWGMDAPEFKENYKPLQLELQGYNKVHILLSFHPDKFKDISPIMEMAKKIDGIEYEQSAN